MKKFIILTMCFFVFSGCGFHEDYKDAVKDAEDYKDAVKDAERYEDRYYECSRERKDYKAKSEGLERHIQAMERIDHLRDESGRQSPGVDAITTHTDPKYNYVSCYYKDDAKQSTIVVDGQWRCSAERAISTRNREKHESIPVSVPGFWR
jgi:hypothetical protein